NRKRLPRRWPSCACPPPAMSPASASPWTAASCAMGSESSPGAAPTFEETLRHFQAFGETDADYLRQHFHRFVVTRRLYDESQPARSRRRVLDVGAHWLHQSHLWARDGHAVTAMDLSLTFDRDSVRRAA